MESVNCAPTRYNLGDRVEAEISAQSAVPPEELGAHIQDSLSDKKWGDLKPELGAGEEIPRRVSTERMGGSMLTLDEFQFVRAIRTSLRKFTPHYPGACLDERAPSPVHAASVPVEA